MLKNKNLVSTDHDEDEDDAACFEIPWPLTPEALSDFDRLRKTPEIPNKPKQENINFNPNCFFSTPAKKTIPKSESKAELKYKERELPALPQQNIKKYKIE